jgi:hypothetical protein
MARYKAIIVKNGERKNVVFTLRVLAAIEFCARLQFYGWKVESIKRIVLP